MNAPDDGESEEAEAVRHAPKAPSLAHSRGSRQRGNRLLRGRGPVAGAGHRPRRAGHRNANRPRVVQVRPGSLRSRPQLRRATRRLRVRECDRLWLAHERGVRRRRLHDPAPARPQARHGEGSEWRSRHLEPLAGRRHRGPVRVRSRTPRAPDRHPVADGRRPGARRADRDRRLPGDRGGLAARQLRQPLVRRRGAAGAARPGEPERGAGPARRLPRHPRAVDRAGIGLHRARHQCHVAARHGVRDALLRRAARHGPAPGLRRDRHALAS